MFERAKKLLRRLLRASEEEWWRIIKSMTPLDLAALDAWFEFWAHKNQLPPNCDGWRKPSSTAAAATISSVCSASL